MARKEFNRQWRAEMEFALEMETLLSASRASSALCVEYNLDDHDADYLTSSLLSDRPLTYAKDRNKIIPRLEGFSQRQCQAVLRMTRVSFVKLYPAFHNVGYRKQEEVAAQLAVVLDRLGHNGNGVGITRLAESWNRSEGSCTNYTSRVVQALLSLKDRFVSWPTPVQRRLHSTMARKGFRNCVGFVDGTTVSFFERPNFQGDFYYERHGQYSLSAQVVCGVDRKIILCFLG
ncbi:hypothetical protein BGX33_004415 [Mortierella sp. NVP41]|nr:hypothetical protein BGX33_004415 [Mortierella sp. NVP41]